MVSHAMIRLRRLWKKTYLYNRFLDAARYSYPLSHHTRCAQPLLEQLEPRLFLHGSGTAVEGTYVHQWIAQQAAYYYQSCVGPTEIGNGVYLGTIPSSSVDGLLTSSSENLSTGRNILEGSREEDTFLVWMNHFAGGGDGDELNVGLLENRSAYEQAELWWEIAIDAYNENSLSSSYYALGRVAHLLADMTVPAHVHLDQHLNESDSYEREIANGFINIYNVQTISFLDYTYTSHPTNTAYAPAASQLRTYNSLESIFRDTANYTEDYDSDDKEGDYNNQSGEIFQSWISSRHCPALVDKSDNVTGSNDMSSQELSFLADDLMPFAIEQTAALYDLFHRAVEYSTGATLAVSVNVSDASVQTGNVLTVSGTAMFDYGSAGVCTEVTTGTAIISFSGHEWTTPVVDGYYNTQITIPSDAITGFISVTISSEGIQGTDSISLTVTGGTTANTWSLVASDIVYQVSETGDGVSWQSKDAFGTDDEYVRRLLYFENITDTEGLWVKWKFYKPDGSQYGEDLVTDIPPAQNSGYEYWDWYYVDYGFDIAGYEASFDPGVWTVKTWVLDSSDEWTYIGSDNFSFLYGDTLHQMASSVNEGVPVLKTNTFTQENQTVWSCLNLEYVAQSLDIKWDWYTPLGDLYGSYTETIPDPSSGDVQWDWYNYPKGINIDGNLAANYTGKWRIEVSVENPARNTWDSIYTDYFEVLESPNVLPTVTLGSPDTVWSDENITVNIQANDNTYLSEVDLFWTDGTTTWSQVWNNGGVPFKNLDEDYNLGAYSSNTTIEYWADAVDTSGNHYLSTREVVDILEVNDQYEDDDTWEDATLISITGIPQVHSISDHGTDIDWIRFDLSERSTVNIGTLGESGDTRLWLYSAEDLNNEIAYDTEGGEASFSKISMPGLTGFDTLPAGTYYVKIDEYGNNENIHEYMVFVEAAAWLVDSYEPDGDQATEIGIEGEQQRHTLYEMEVNHNPDFPIMDPSPLLDQDWLYFDILKESEVTLEINIPSCSGGNIAVETILWSADRDILDCATSYAGENSFILGQGDLLLPGRYYLQNCYLSNEENEVFDLQPGQDPSYDISVYAAPIPDLVSGIDASQKYVDRVEITWNEQSDVIGYEVWRQPIETGILESLGTTTLSSFYDFDAFDLGVCRYFVSAINNVGSSSLGDGALGRVIQTQELVIYVVDSLSDIVADDGKITLREAIEAANSNTAVNEAVAGSDFYQDLIRFSESLSGGMIELSSELDITDDLIIQGLGADKLTISGQETVRIFDIYSANYSSVEVSISGLSLINAYANYDGGAINNSAVLTLDGISFITNCTASCYNGGAIYNRRSARVYNSIFIGNTAKNGGAIYNDGYLALMNSTLTQNMASDSGGALYQSSELEFHVINCTIYNNEATNHGGGIMTVQTTVYSSQSQIINSILINNKVSYYSYNDWDLSGYSSSTIILKGNYLGGIGLYTIPAEISSCNIMSGNLNLAPLGYYGGTMPSMPLMDGSVALDAGDSVLTVDPTTNLALTTDQRGEGYNRISGNSVDIGATEGVEESNPVTQTWIVDTLEDVVAEDGKVSLREAIEAANTNLAVNEAAAGTKFFQDTIIFADVLFGGTIVLTEQLTISEDLIIQGLGARNLVLDANGSGRVFEITSDAEVVIEGITLTGGYFEQSVMSIPSSGGGGIINYGKLTLDKVAVSGNMATGGGGILNYEGTLFVQNSIIDNNEALAGGGILNYGSSAMLNVTNSTIAYNHAIQIPSAGQYGLGGGIYNFNGYEININNATIVMNDAAYYGGIYSVPVGFGINMFNTILAGNTSSVNPAFGDTYSVAFDCYNNLIGNAQGFQGLPTETNIILGTSEIIGSELMNLDYYDSPVKVMPLIEGSMAINTGDDTFAIDFNGNQLVYDAAGMPRFKGMVDIGAYEYYPVVASGIDLDLGSGVTNGKLLDMDGDGTPDTVMDVEAGQSYSVTNLSDSTQVAVNTFLVNPDEAEVQITVNKADGWIYTSFADPFEGTRELLSITASDGRVISPNNWWIDNNGNICILDDPDIVYELDYENPAIVVGRNIFYNNSSFDTVSDDNAIASDKQALFAGNKATFDNYTSYTRGINGIMIDISGMAGTVTATDFSFRIGNSDTTSAWTSAPLPASVVVRSGEGDSGSDRVVIVWADSVIVNKWLEVTVLANENTGLASNDVFYFGNAIGETGNSSLNASVNISDMALGRVNQTGFTQASITNFYDFNRDKKVNVTDIGLARSHQSGFSPLRLIDLTTNEGIAATSDIVLLGQTSNKAAILQQPSKSIWLDSDEEDDEDSLLAMLQIA